MRRSVRWSRMVGRVCDVLLPGVGALLGGRVWIGATALAMWGLAVIAVSGGVCLLGIHPLQGAVVVGIVHLTLLLWVGVEPLGEHLRPGRALVGIAGLGLLLLGGLYLGLGSSCIPVAVRDRCAFPGLLPGEVVLVHRFSAEASPPRLGDLVAADTPAGPIIARVVGSAGDRIVLDGPSLTVNDAVVPSTEIGTVHLPEELGTPREETKDLSVYEEELSGKHLFFFRKGVVVETTAREVPDGHVYLLCDNRSTTEAVDSRELGAIPLGRVVGRLGPIIWSPNPGRGVRVERLGAVWK